MLQSWGLVFFGAVNPGFIISSTHADKVSHGIIIREADEAVKNGNTVYSNVLLWLILFQFVQISGSVRVAVFFHMLGQLINMHFAICYTGPLQIQLRETRTSWYLDTHTEAKWIIFLLPKGSALHTVKEQRFAVSRFLSDGAEERLEVFCSYLC